MSSRFAGQVVLITGASSGIGAELARQFAAEGARVALVAGDRDIEAGTIGVLGAVSVATACLIPGSPAAEVASIRLLRPLNLMTSSSVRSRFSCAAMSVKARASLTRSDLRA